MPLNKPSVGQLNWGNTLNDALDYLDERIDNIPAGATGPTGPSGDDGFSAYQIAVQNGFEGTEQEWLDSLGGSGSADIADFTFEYEENEESRMTIHNHDMRIQTTRDDNQDADIEINSADDIWMTANDTVEITSVTDEVRIITGEFGQKQWNFRQDGVISIDGNTGIEVTDDGDIKGRLKFEPGNGRALLQAYANSQTATFTESWDTATWTVLDSQQSQLTLTNASAIISFMENTGYQVDNLKISVNGSYYAPYSGAGTGDGAITLYINELMPPEGEFTLTELAFQYAFSSKVDVDFDEGELVIRTEDEMNTLIDSDDTLTLRSRTNQTRVQANGDVVFTANYGEDSQYVWRMRQDGRFEFPTEGYIKSLFGNSSDGNNYDTIEVVPDFGLYDNGSNQHLVIEPTAPNHIHIRAGGTIDQSTADLILGGEVNNVHISDADGDVTINANSAVDITSGGTMTLTANGGDMNIYMDGGLYIGASASGNQIVKQSDISNRVIKAAVPEAANSSGGIGDVSWDTDYFYVCVAPSTWKRIALSTWT